MIRTPAWKRYNWRVAWISVVYVVFLLGAVYGFNGCDPQSGPAMAAKPLRGLLWLAGFLTADLLGEGLRLECAAPNLIHASHGLRLGGAGPGS